jgi:hypothetical protein
MMPFPENLALPVVGHEQALARAEWAETLAVGYGLGAGGRTPERPSPADDSGHCDCSAYTAWCRGLRRQGWNTDAMRRDILGPQRTLLRLERPIPGAIVVFGAGADVGHCGLVKRVPRGWDGSRRAFAALVVSHASPKNSRGDAGHAIKATSGQLFYQPGDVVFGWDVRWPAPADPGR